MEKKKKWLKKSEMNFIERKKRKYKKKLQLKSNVTVLDLSTQKSKLPRINNE